MGEFQHQLCQANTANTPTLCLSLKAVLSMYRTPKQSTGCLPDFSRGATIQHQEPNRGPASNWLNSAPFSQHTDAIMRDETQHCKRSAVQATPAHEMQAEQEQVMVEESSCTTPWADQKGEAGEDMATTMFIRHIPFRYTNMEFMKFIDLQGFKGLYDYYYQPTDYQTGHQRTYAFVNFVTPSIAKAFKTKVHGMQLDAQDEHPPLSVITAYEQGLYMNFARYYTRKVHRRKKRKCVCPIFPEVDLRSLPQAEATARQLIEAVGMEHSTPHWKPAPL